MKIKNIRIRNYKGFADSGWISLSDRFNVIVGQNNAGKSSIIEAFRFGANQARPHRSLRRPEGVEPPPASEFRAEIQTEIDELDIAGSRLGNQYFMPVRDTTEQGVHELFERVRAGFCSEFVAVSGSSFANTKWPGHGQFEDPGSRARAAFSLNQDRTSWRLSGVNPTADDNTNNIIQILSQLRIYVFNAERYNVGRCALVDTDILHPNCQNLPAVLFKLNKNKIAFEKFNDFVSQIFPSIKSVTVSQSGQDLEIFVYTVETMRPDLAVSLSESGTGIAQVLSIVYVLMTQRRSVIAIDEPNSFLHPGAVKKLSEIMQLFPDHQYIISTHSPEVVSSLGSENLIFVRSEDGESKVQVLDMDVMSDVRTVLDDVGASLSDVFGLEAVVWVEGQTEAECFPELLRAYAGRSPIGLSFVAMRNTGDFDRRRRDPREPWEIYDRLSKGGSLLPISVAFSFDREGRSDQSIADMERQSGGTAHFLPRAMYENYLLDSQAIAEVIGTELGVAPGIDEVEAKLRAALDGESIESVDAARILTAIFADLTDEKLEFRKLKHSVGLTRWLIENRRDHLLLLGQYVSSLVPDRYSRTVT